ncbi:VanZ family protein [Senegalia sp. (in: firmicutes)]|uniref:VanZ family protein n=1 Tax=Senegalia sp. (in: firmicutes) TaxID=1924098 RepID=UPI003F9DA514
MIKEENKKKISWLAVFIWMGIIFYLSAQPSGESSNLSSGISDFVLHIINTIFKGLDFNIDEFHFIIRKSAHFTAYFILATLTLNALRRSEVYGHKSIMIALVISIIYAASDEFHQSFVPGRGPAIKDVFIDTSGAISGLLVYMVSLKLLFKRRI